MLLRAYSTVGPVAKTASFVNSSSRKADLIKRNNQRTDALSKTLFVSTAPPALIRECYAIMRKSSKKEATSLAAESAGILDSDEEEALHREVDNISKTQENEDGQYEGWWEKNAAKLFNQLSLNVVHLEQTLMLLHHIFCCGLAQGQKPEPDPLLTTNHVARGLVALHTPTKDLDVDACVAEVHAQYKPFRLLLTPLERRANKDEISGELRFSSLIAASKQFRSAIHTMHVDRTLTAVMKSQLAKFFNEEEARNLLGENSRCEKKKNKDLLHDDSKWADQKFLTLVIAGEVLVVRTLDEEEIGMGKCSVGCFFGAWKNLNPQDDVPESEKETPIKEGGTGVNNCIIKADGPCKIIRIPITNLSQVLKNFKPSLRELFNEKLLERLTFDASNLEKLNSLLLETIERDSFQKREVEQWLLKPHERDYYKGVPELEREQIQDFFSGIQNLWTHLSRGANTVPKGTVDLIKDFLGESGLQCFTNVFLPMEEHTAPNVFDEESFWFCWINFLKISIEQAEMSVIRNGLDDDDDFEEDQNAMDQGDGRNVKGVVTILLKSAQKLLPMDTFSGKADPYLVVTVDGITQKTSIKRLLSLCVFSFHFSLSFSLRMTAGLRCVHVFALCARAVRH